MSLDKSNILVVGAGNIGSAIARGIARAGHIVTVANRSAVRLEQFEGDARFITYTDLATAISEAQPGLVVICTEGQAVQEVIDIMGAAIRRYRPVVVSCAAASTLSQLETWLAPYLEKPEIVRVLPTIAAVEGLSANLVCSRGADDETIGKLKTIFEATGSWHEIPEKNFGAAMALTSCGIAFALRYIRAEAEAGVELGLAPKVAASLAASAFLGAAALLEAANLNPEVLIDRVTTPGGLTIKGLNAMEAAGLTPAIIAGIKAATRNVK